MLILERYGFLVRKCYYAINLFVVFTLLGLETTRETFSSLIMDSASLFSPASLGVTMFFGFSAEIPGADGFFLWMDSVPCGVGFCNRLLDRFEVPGTLWILASII